MLRIYERFLIDILLKYGTHFRARNMSSCIWTVSNLVKALILKCIYMKGRTLAATVNQDFYNGGPNSVNGGLNLFRLYPIQRYGERVVILCLIYLTCYQLMLFRCTN